jgi:hypothetical protein
MWVASCQLIGDDPDRAGIWCLDWWNDGEDGTKVMDEGRVAYGSWHSFLIAFDPERLSCSYQIDGYSVATFTPMHADKLRSAAFRLTVGVGTNSSDTIVGNFDDVRIGVVDTTSEPTAVASPTRSLAGPSTLQSPTPAKLEVRETAPQRGALILDEEFDDNSNFWLEDYYRFFANGEYHVSTFDISSGLWEIGTAPRYSDFIVDVEARKVEGRYGEGWGIAFRVSDDLQHSYLVRINGNGVVDLIRVYPDHWEDIAPFPLTTDAVYKGNAANRLTVAASGSHLQVFVNDQFVGGAVDDYLDAGTIQIFGGAEVHVAFDFIRVYELAAGG